jgi:hypothetical protein
MAGTSTYFQTKMLNMLQMFTIAFLIIKSNDQHKYVKQWRKQRTFHH